MLKNIPRNVHRSAILRGIKTLVIAENTPELTPATLSTIRAANELQGELSILVLNKHLAEKVSLLKVNKVLLAPGKEYENAFCEPVSELASKLAKKENFSTILVSHSSFGREVAPRLAASLSAPQLSDVTNIEGDCFTRGVYAGNAITKLRCASHPRVVTVRQSSFEPKVPQRETPAEIQVIDIPSSSLKTFIEDKRTAGHSVDLSSAEIVVGGGRSFMSKENFQLVVNLAKKLNAGVGATRAAVDQGFAPSEAQVGQTGKSISPKLYIALGISGAIQHVSGIMDSKVIVAVNKDKEAPIFNVSNYGIIGDVNSVTRELTEKL